MTMTLIETKTLVSAAASIEFTSIPQDGTDLFLLISGRTNRALEGDGFYVRFNGSTTGYTARRLIGAGTTPSVSSDTGITSLFASAANATANTFGNASVYIPNYAGSTNKSYSNEGVSENNATTAFLGLFAGLWSNTAAITSVLLNPDGGTEWIAGTTISLYKITKGSDGIVTTS